MAKSYAQSELDFLNQYYPIYGVNFCSNKLQRTIESIRVKASRLKLTSGKQIFDESIQIDIDIIPNEKINSKFILDPLQITKESAYFIGFFWADGYIRRNKELVIEIVKEDGDLLIDSFNKLGIWGISTRSRENRKPTLTFQTTNEKLCNFFTQIGKYSKSSDSHEKILNHIPKEYHSHFLRGLIDGDGCFYIGNDNKRIQFSLTSNLNQNWTGISKLLDENNIISTNKQSFTNIGNSSLLRITENQSIINIINYIYKDCDNIYLPRKLEKSNKIIEILKNKKIDYNINS